MNESFQPASFELVENKKENMIQCHGHWVISFLDNINQQLATINSTKLNQINIQNISKLDLTGAWFLFSFSKKRKIPITGINSKHRYLFTLCEKQNIDFDIHSIDHQITSITKRLENAFRFILHESTQLLNFLGAVIVSFYKIFVGKLRFRTTPFVYHMEKAGIHSIPIIVAVMLLIGIVIAYMGSIELERFGAQIYTFNLVAVSILREIGILLVAIMLAGRSGSAFTAQIGTMVVNEEIDAMKTMGFDLFEMIVIPRIAALVITFPLIVFIANIAGLAGGIFMGMTTLDTRPEEVLSFYKESTTFWNFWTGMLKAPFFAIIIGIVGCYKGLCVEKNAASVGQMTTQSVVISIFLIIIADSLFAIFFAMLGI